MQRAGGAGEAGAKSTDGGDAGVIDYDQTAAGVLEAEGQGMLAEGREGGGVDEDEIGGGETAEGIGAEDPATHGGTLVEEAGKGLADGVEAGALLHGEAGEGRVQPGLAVLQCGDGATGGEKRLGAATGTELEYIAQAGSRDNAGEEPERRIGQGEAAIRSGRRGWLGSGREAIQELTDLVAGHSGEKAGHECTCAGPFRTEWPVAARNLGESNTG